MRIPTTNRTANATFALVSLLMLFLENGTFVNRKGYMVCNTNGIVKICNWAILFWNPRVELDAGKTQAMFLMFSF
jgi:hypothetical protein